MTTTARREKIFLDEKLGAGRNDPETGRRSGGFGRHRRLVRVALGLGWLALASGVSGCRNEVGSAPQSSPVPAASVTAAPAPVAAAAAGPTVVFLGDSLTAGLGLGEEAAYPALVGKLLAERGRPVRIVNAGVSGDTSAGGLARLDWLLSLQPDFLVVALGANDGLRGQPVASIEANLREIVRRGSAAGAQVVLAGMKMPPNYGPEYTRDFEAVYTRLARELDLPFLPFLLEGVAADPQLNQEDGIHPTAEGQRRISLLVAELLQPLVESPSGAATAP